MLKNKNLNKSLSVLLVSVYAFVVLFSARFHHHSHGFFTGNEFSKTEKSVKNFTQTSGENDCIACHFLTNKISFSPEQFAYEIFSFEENISVETFFLNREISTEVLYFNLRAPPCYFI